MRATWLIALGLAAALGGCMTAAEQRSADEAQNWLIHPAVRER